MSPALPHRAVGTRDDPGTFLPAWTISWGGWRVLMPGWCRLSAQKMPATLHDEGGQGVVSPLREARQLSASGPGQDRKATRSLGVGSPYPYDL
jgi:hypothetical protein